MNKPFRRSRTDRMIAGVCGGLAESLGIDAIWIRLLFVFGGGVFLWVYIALCLIFPAANSGDDF